jgi:hypothetical protein
MTTLTKTLYDTDFNLWIEQTVNQLKNGSLKDLDLENLIEEIESMGRSDKREIISRLRILIMHLLKWKYQPEKRTSSWIATINEQRYQIQVVLKDSPSLKPYFRDNFADCYQIIRRDAAKETTLPLNTFPVDCPFSQEQILDPDYFHE